MTLEEIKMKLCLAKIPNGEITDIELVAEAAVSAEQTLPFGPMPEYIKVKIACRPEERSYIRIEVWLPTEIWNGDFLGTGNGGAAGELLPVVMIGPLKLGFAVANTDMGTSAGADCGIGNSAVWKDFGHRATHLMTVVAKEVIQCYYGAGPKHAYFSGTSTGGQQALQEAQMYPNDYDGILAGAPAFDRVNLHLGFLWDWLAINAGHGGSYTAEDAHRIVQAVLKLRGQEGGRPVDRPYMEHPHMITDMADVLAQSGFTPEQVQSLTKIYMGATDPVTGHQIYEPTMMPGSEACDLGLVARCEHPKFAQEFFYLFRWVLGKDFDFTAFDFHKDARRVHEALDNDLNAAAPDLSAFRDRGGKLLLVHGTADPIIPYTSSLRYYSQVQQKMGSVDQFFRLYLIPGMAHTFGGPGAQDIVFGFPATPKDKEHLALLALKEWVETGDPPEALHPVVFRDNDLSNAFRADGLDHTLTVHPYGL